MKDRQGVELEVGMSIVYATSTGSTVYLEDAVVQQVFDEEQKVKVGKFRTYNDYKTGALIALHSSVYLRRPNRIIIMGMDNAEDSADRHNVGPRP